MRTRARKLLMFVLLIAVGVAVRERRTASQIQVADPLASHLRSTPPRSAPRPAPAPTPTPADTGSPTGDDDLSTPFTTAPDGAGDDLKKIRGVGPKLETVLHAQGITTFAQMASLSDADIDRLEARLNQFPGRIRRDGWVEQAQALSGEGE